MSKVVFDTGFKIKFSENSAYLAFEANKDGSQEITASDQDSDRVEITLSKEHVQVLIQYLGGKVYDGK